LINFTIETEIDRLVAEVYCATLKRVLEEGRGPET
jgi:hypothetical protein